MNYTITIMKPYKETFQGDGRQFTINEMVRFYLGDVPDEQLASLIPEIQTRGYKIESIESR